MKNFEFCSLNNCLSWFAIRQLGTHYPDHALALVSAAGWIKKEDYGDSNLFFRHDISTSHTSPAIKGILEACTAENDADKHVSNLHVSKLQRFIFGTCGACMLILPTPTLRVILYSPQISWAACFKVMTS